MKLVNTGIEWGVYFGVSADDGVTINWDETRKFSTEDCTVYVVKVRCRKTGVTKTVHVHGETLNAFVPNVEGLNERMWV